MNICLNIVREIAQTSKAKILAYQRLPRLAALVISAVGSVHESNEELPGKQHYATIIRLA